MTTVGSFINEHSDQFFVGKEVDKDKTTYYFKCSDFDEHWNLIDISKYIFSNEELININSIIHNDKIK